jgi:serine/threonine-protein kinase
MRTDPPPSDVDPVDRLAEEYLARHRRGERPTRGEYAARHPEHAARILELFPALELIERLKPAPGDAAGLSGSTGPGVEPGVAASDRLRRLGDYTILREIGRGGMGVVYEAEHDSLKSRVALKVMHTRFRADPTSLRRFQTEARSAARLHHTNIVPVFDFGEQDGICYYAMQYITGVGLERVLEDVRRLRAPAEPRAASGPSLLSEGTAIGAAADPLSVVSRGLMTGRYAIDPPAAGSEPTATVTSESARADDRVPAAPPVAAGPDGSTLSSRADSTYFREVARLSSQVADALDYAHRQGVVHRDIKPSNLLLDPQGNAWVADFGLAKLVEDEGLSQSQGLVGTLRFMAPERFEGVTDPRGDVYALGATLYELLTLQPAFDGQGHAELVRQIREQPPVPPRRLDPRIPRDLETIVLKALAKDPADRFAAAGELRDELRRYLEGRPIRSRPVGLAEQFWRWCKRNPGQAIATTTAAVVTTLLAIGATTAAWVYRDQRNALGAANTATNRALGESQENLARADSNFALARDAVDRFYTRISEDKLLNEPHMDRLRKDLLGSAREFYRKFADQRQGDPRSQADLGRAYWRLARIARDLGETQEALDDAEQSRAIFERLAQRPPEEIAYQTDLARSYFTLGEVCWSATRYAEAEAALKTARAIQEKVSQSSPDFADNQQDLAMTHQRTGALYYDMGRFAEAEQRYLDAADLRRKLTAAHPRNTLYQSQLAQGYTNLSALYGRMLRGPEAEKAGLASLAINQELVAANPGIAEYRENLAYVHGNLGYTVSTMGRLTETEEHFLAALAICRELAAAHPEVTAYQLRQALFHRNLGEVYLRTGRIAQAEASLKEALASRQKLAATHPERLEYVAFVGSSDSSLGALAQHQGDLLAAVGWYERSIAILEDALRREPRHMLSRLFLMRAFWGRAEAVSRLGRHIEAIADYDRALGLDDGSEGDLIRLDRAIATARAGDHVQALAQAEPLARSVKIPLADRCYKLARVLARAAAAVRDDPKLVPTDRAARAEKFAARAIEQLAQARDAGHFVHSANLDELRKDPDWAPLRARREFEMFVMDLIFPADPFSSAENRRTVVRPGSQPARAGSPTPQRREQARENAAGR